MDRLVFASSRYFIATSLHSLSAGVLFTILRAFLTICFETFSDPIIFFNSRRSFRVRNIIATKIAAFPCLLSTNIQDVVHYLGGKSCLPSESAQSAYDGGFCFSCIGAYLARRFDKRSGLLSYHVQI